MRRSDKPPVQPAAYVLIESAPRNRELLPFPLEVRHLPDECRAPRLRGLELLRQRQPIEVRRQADLRNVILAQPCLELRRQLLLGRQQADVRAVLRARGAHLRAQQHAAGDARQLLERGRVADLDADEIQARRLGALRCQRLDRGQEHQVAVDGRQLGLQRLLPPAAVLGGLQVLADHAGDGIDGPRRAQGGLAGLHASATGPAAGRP